MKLSETGRALIERFEGLRLDPYYDQNGLATIGYGHLLTAVPWAHLGSFASIDLAMADALLVQDVGAAESAVDKLLAGRALSQPQFDALVSLTFNIGANAFASSTLRRVVSAGRPVAEIRAAFLMWDKVTDPKTGILVPSVGLTERREAEADLYASGTAL